MLIKVNYTVLSKGKGIAQGPSSMLRSQAQHHIPTPLEIIEISDAEPDLPQSTGVNQSPVPSLAAGHEIIEISSSDGEDRPQSPQSPLIQTSLQPLISSPHEVERMMSIDNITQYSLPLPPSPPHPQILQVNTTLETTERNLMEVPALSSPSSPVHHQHAFESAETSEPEEGPLADDDSNPPPPSSSGSPSHLIPLPGYPTPTVRYLIYGGPNGIFKDANASILQHMQTSTSDAIVPEAHSPQQTPETTEVKGTFVTFEYHLTLYPGPPSPSHY